MIPYYYYDVIIEFLLSNNGIKHELIYNTTHSHQAGPGAHLASYTLGIGPFP